MKKITLALALMAMGAQAQTFPGPYCEVTPTTVEEITSLSLEGVTITNTDLTSTLIDHTATVINVTPGETVFLEYHGNTHGNFKNEFVAYIDWDQNGLLDDPMDVMQIGYIENSTGFDNEYVIAQFTIPNNALLGQTRIRITKTAVDDDSMVLTDPCKLQRYDWMTQTVLSSAGQAIDFTLNVQTLGVETFEESALTVFPNPTKDVLNVKYKSVINTVKIYNLLGQEVLAQNAKHNQLQIDVSALTAGAYIVKLFADKGEHSLRMIKK